MGSKAITSNYLYVIRTNTPDELLAMESDFHDSTPTSKLKVVNSFGPKVARIPFLECIHLGPDSRGGTLERALSSGEQPIIVVDNLIKASRVFDILKQVIVPGKRLTIGLSGPPGAGKSEFAAVLASYFTEAQYPSYILSLDNYYHRTSEDNMQYRIELLQRSEVSLRSYLGSQEELDLQRVGEITAAFKSGADTVALRHMDLLTSELLDNNRIVSLADTRLLLLEGTWSMCVPSVDLQVYIMSRPDLTLLRRVKRGREPITPELERTIALEQSKLIDLYPGADLIIHDDYFIEFPSGRIPALMPDDEASETLQEQLAEQHRDVGVLPSSTARTLRIVDAPFCSLPPESLEQTIERARETVHALVLPQGIVASSAAVTNYRRVWARDSVITGIGGLVAGDTRIVDGLKASVSVLASHVGPDGQIPSNVGVSDSGAVSSVSYGGIAGRVDTVPWYIIGACHYGLFAQDRAFLDAHRPTILQGLSLLDTWEFNRRGLIYMPQGGDWADEYIYHGYVLLPQLLRLWATQLCGEVFGDSAFKERALFLRRLIEVNYWPTEENLKSDLVYHRHAFEKHLDSPSTIPCFQASLSPTGYGRQFDFFGNALATLLQLGTSEQRTALLDHGQQVVEKLVLHICPAFWPPVFEGDPEWASLTAYFRDKFSNVPFHYHNGGSWPMVTGWWGSALTVEKRRDEAIELLNHLQTANALGREGRHWEFNECFSSLTGEPNGVTPCAWSASAPLLLASMLAGSTRLCMANPEC